MMISLKPYLKLQGNAKEAIQFYEQVLDASILHIQTYADLPMPFPDSLKNQIAHAVLKVGDSEIMFSDSPEMPVQIGDNVTISISTNHVEVTKRIFDALQAGGNVIASLEETPFSPAFGTVKDKFGVTFTIVTEHQNG